MILIYLKATKLYTKAIFPVIQRLLPSHSLVSHVNGLPRSVG